MKSETDRAPAAAPLAVTDKARDLVSRDRIAAALLAAARSEGESLEARLKAQAEALDVIFAELADRGARYIGEHLGAAEAYLRLALKAQAQCRATVATLADLKNPRPVISQTNIAASARFVNTNADKNQ